MMASKNGESVYDIVTDSWRRSVAQMNGSGSVGIYIPAEFAEEYGIEVGDDVAIREREGEGILELHFE